MFLTCTKKESSCDDKDAMFSAMWIIKAKCNELKIPHSVLENIIEGMKENTHTDPTS